MYATPTIKPISMDAETSSCCLITFYSATTQTTFTQRNPACGSIINQFPTCGDINSPILHGASSGAGAADPFSVVNQLVATVKNTLAPIVPVPDLCVVSVSGNTVVGPMAVSANFAVSGS
jgi:hypothetical protein